MDNTTKFIIFGIVIIIFLIALKFVLFPDPSDTDVLIPGVTDNRELIEIIDSNSTTGEIILNDTFYHEISGIHIENKSELYGTNETTGKKLFEKCCDSLLVHGMTEMRKEIGTNRYISVYSDDYYNIIFYIFEGEDVKEMTGYNVILTTYRGLAS